MTIMKRKANRMICMLMVLAMVAGFLLPMQVSAETEKQAHVRVGWYKSDLFQEGMSDDEEKSGYSYKYLQVLASYSGWKYEYVYGDWPQLLEMLRNGEIDVMAGVSDTPEREAFLSYPYYEMGKETYCLYQQTDNATMNVSDMSTFNGQTIGAIRDNLMTTCLEQWIRDNNVNLKVKYYDTFEERDADFEACKINGAVATDNNIMRDTGYSIVTEVGAEPYYLAVTKSRPDLLNQLNEALTLMDQMDPYFIQNLEYDSYGLTLKNTSMTDLEEEWLEEHDSLTIGYMDNYLPYCDQSADGSVNGLIVDVVDAMLTNLGIKDTIEVRYVGFTSYEAMLDGVRKDMVDVIFPAGGSSWEMDRDGIDATNTVVASGMDLVYKGLYSMPEKPRFAVNRNNKLQLYYTKRCYPDAEIIEFDNVDGCLYAVDEGLADFTIINGLRIEIVNSDSRYSSLHTMQLHNSDERYFAVKDGNVALLLLLNRGIRLIGSDFGTNASYSYINQNHVPTVGDFVRNHMFGAFLFVVLLFTFVLVIFIFYIRGIKQAQKETEEANRAKTVFLNNMSHDIRTPMNAILGFTDILEKKKEDPELLSEYIEKIRVSGEYLLNIINNVLDMSRIESGKVTVDESVMDILGEENNLMTSIGDMFSRKNQKLTATYNVEHRYVVTDVQKIKEIITNLLSNANKYTPENGEISLCADELPSDKPGYGRYRIIVKDNGIGMSEEYMEHIFDSFSRERNTTDSKVIGTGLGMSIVKKLVDILGGTIEVESEMGKGSTFTVILDHKIATPPASVPADRQQAADDSTFAEGRRILLTEDNEFNAEIAIEILEEKGFVVEHAKDGLECIDMLVNNEARYYDLILMDIQMPNLNGYDATVRIRELEDAEKSSIPIIAMTANAFEEDKQHALDVGMNAHLAKPINTKLLMEVLRGILAQ